MGKKKEKLKKMGSNQVKQIVENMDVKRKPDLYSQIFADTTDSEADEKSSSQTEKSQDTIKSRFTSKSQFQSAIQNVGEKQAIIKSNNKTRSPPKQNTSAQIAEDSSGSEAGDYEFDDNSNDDEDMDNEEFDEAAVSHASESGDEEQSEDSSNDEESDGDSVSQTALRKQLKDLSYEELESLKQKMGLKEYNEAMFASKSRASSKKKKRKFERLNKNRPREISSKIRVPKLRQVVKVPKKITKDPRFDDKCGEYNEKFWSTEYSFIRDIQKKEAEDMKKKLKSVDDKSKKKEMKRFIQRVTDKEKFLQAKQNEEKKRLQDKEENRKRMQEGKRPFYMKKSTKKLAELVEKYDELKASGRLEKYLKKKRKKNAFRDKKALTG